MFRRCHEHSLSLVIRSTRQVDLGFQMSLDFVALSLGPFFNYSPSLQVSFFFQWTLLGSTLADLSGMFYLAMPEPMIVPTLPKLSLGSMPPSAELTWKSSVFWKFSITYWRNHIALYFACCFTLLLMWKAYLQTAEFGDLQSKINHFVFLPMSNEKNNCWWKHVMAGYEIGQSLMKGSVVHYYQPSCE